MLHHALKLLSLLLLSLLASISHSAESNTDNLTPVSLQLIWKHQFQFAGYYVAKHKGFYQQAGLDVSIHEFENDEDPVATVLSGKRDFALGRSTILAQRINGARVTALFATFQSSPLMLLTTTASGISKPADLRGKRIMMTSDAEKQVELLAMLHQSGITEADFERQNHSFDINDLIDGKTDAMASYRSNEPFQLMKKGISYTMIRPEKFGFSMYSDLLFTSDTLLQEKPELVEAFRQATIKGWRYAFSHIEETADLILAEYNSQNRSKEALVYEGEQLATLAFDQEGRFGSINEEKLNAISQLYLLFNLIPSDYTIGNFIYQPKDHNRLSLNHREQQFLANNPTFKVCGDPLWEPYSQLTFNRYEGVIPDYLQLISERTGLRFETITSQVWSQSIAAMKAAKCDIIAGAMQTPNRAQYMQFSHPYLSMPAVLAVRSDTPADMPLQEIFSHPVAIIEESAFIEIIRGRIPDAHIVPVASVTDGLKRIQSGEVFALLNTPDGLSSAISQRQLSGIKVIDQVRDTWDISVAINRSYQDTPLLSIINKAINSITPAERDEIRNRWIRITFEHETDYSLLWRFVSIISIALLFLIYRYRLIHMHNQQLREIARHDQLTGLYNRRMLNDALTDSIEISRRYKRPFSIVFFDLDDFKEINDRFGHNEGDRVLKVVADILHSNCRLSDHYGRWGGEEFLIVLPESTLKDAQSSAEKLRRAIEEHDFTLSTAAQITGSFGVAQFEPGDTINSVIDRADQALYRAKSSGKNRVCKAQGNQRKTVAELQGNH
ncbi:polar amino acid transport system substrate-binding protein [Amphritea atlantica]|uniref:diguanylate cyclase n=1 Tax=Amphritea atlantica TaxID=355243 RepID=A0A1H9JU05_9GAMM|nr:diguanylate cyclase [Amphritea atlantica]SEQ90396.1 polar amino acid transport system substrate-binding protein [Amphritea atlantica]